jgi:NAD(P)-dependent dehydrogenase (short-subunit alcohol dehydrogenase family)
VKTFGKDVALGRAGQPAELAPVFVLLASEDASYMAGRHGRGDRRQAPDLTGAARRKSLNEPGS